MSEEPEFILGSPPNASFICPSIVIAGEKVIFDGSDSHDPDNDYIAFLWDFGDGKMSYGPKVSHIYNTPGEYKVNLTVTDRNGDISRTSSFITVNTLSSKL